MTPCSSKKYAQVSDIEPVLSLFLLVPLKYPASLKLETAPTSLLPTPVTAESESKPRLHLYVRPSRKSRNLTAKLLSLANDDQRTEPVCQDPRSTEEMHATESDILEKSSREVEYDDDLNPLPSSPGVGSIESVLIEPVTPPPKPRIEQRPFFERFSKSCNKNVVYVSENEIRNIPKVKLHNPFIAQVILKETHTEPSEIDYSIHLELVNHRTGERKIKELNAEQRGIKPRRLDFSLAEQVPVNLNYNITNKYIESNLGPPFSMESSLAKSSMGFDIFLITQEQSYKSQKMRKSS